MKLGIDVGSTTAKAALIADDGTILYSAYQRHNSQVADSLASLLKPAYELAGHNEVPVAISGSAGMGLAADLGLPFVQEVFAESVAVERFVPEADVAIELGGEDAKILFFTGLRDARMNGACAGGTGAFIDQMATLLKIAPDELNELAKSAKKKHIVASRCGVFAKTDIQQLLNQGALIEDICASILDCIVSQTIAGLAQGRKIAGNVVYLGGPLSFLSQLRAAFDRELGITGILPENSLYYVAIGAAMLSDEAYSIDDILERLDTKALRTYSNEEPLFASESQYFEFVERHKLASVEFADSPNYSGIAHLGIDAGSTTIKTVLITPNAEILKATYEPNAGNPVKAVLKALSGIYEEFPNVVIGSATTTGYGEAIVKEAIKADFSLVETIAHYRAAKHFMPEVDFILDVGGQDIKCFKISNGAISDIFLNEACSSGCGSFLYTFAESLGMSVEEFANIGLFSPSPASLGSRCTVFMNSSVKQAQKEGASVASIAAGLAISVVKNALYKVIRTNNAASLGSHIVVQGGTFYNDSILRAFEREIGANVVRPSISGLMGAFGAALSGMGSAGENPASTCISLGEIASFEHKVRQASCGLCANKCSLSINIFGQGRRFVSGNKCSRPNDNNSAIFEGDIFDYKLKKLDLDSSIPAAPLLEGKPRIGIPMVLNFFEMYPFWKALFGNLGIELATSPRSSRELFFLGQSSIPSDTICYPAKLVHGHIMSLCEMRELDAIFYPCMTYNFDEEASDNHFNCPVVAYYPEVVHANSMGDMRVPFIYSHMAPHAPNFPEKLHSSLLAVYPNLDINDVKKACQAGFAAHEFYLEGVREKGRQIIEDARKEGKHIIVLAGRPYHVDEEVNHGINKIISGLGVSIISEDAISHLADKKPRSVLNQWTYHARLYAAADYVATQPDMSLVQLISFGCGLDAVTADEVSAILSKAGKIYTQIKIDEIANMGAATIRIRSLLAAVTDRFGNEEGKADGQHELQYAF